jgi:prepilin signal peptidase PulO-like enzyme (type II secretory pathway)
MGLETDLGPGILYAALLLVLSAGAGFLTGYGAIFVFNRAPADWFCEYGERPDARHVPPRVGKYPWAPLFSLVLGAAACKAGLVAWTYGAAVLPALCLLLLIGMADQKYSVIPDQFVILLAVTGIGFAAMGRSFFSPLLGSLAGGGLFFLIGWLGKRIAKRDVMGFGDVKLMAVCGLLTGPTGVGVVTALAAFTSAAVFSFWLATGRVKATDEKPLGPFLAGAAAVYLIFSPEITTLLRLMWDVAPL